MLQIREKTCFIQYTTNRILINIIQCILYGILKKSSSLMYTYYIHYIKDWHTLHILSSMKTFWKKSEFHFNPLSIFLSYSKLHFYCEKAFPQYVAAIHQFSIVDYFIGWVNLWLLVAPTVANALLSRWLQHFICSRHHQKDLHKLQCIQWPYIFSLVDQQFYY